MVRVLKKYRLAVRETAADDAPLVAGHSASFSSYPGLIYSGDDFTVLSSGLVAMETTIGNSNKDLWKYVKPVGTVLEGVRSVVANRLATSGQFSFLFSFFPFFFESQLFYPKLQLNKWLLLVKMNWVRKRKKNCLFYFKKLWLHRFNRINTTDY